MKLTEATTFHRKSGQGLEIDPEDDLSAVGAALNQCVIKSEAEGTCGSPRVNIFDKPRT